MDFVCSCEEPISSTGFFLKSNSRRHVCRLSALRRRQTQQIGSACVFVRAPGCVGPLARGAARGIVRIIFPPSPYWMWPITAAPGKPVGLLSPRPLRPQQRRRCFSREPRTAPGAVKNVLGKQKEKDAANISEF